MFSSRSLFMPDAFLGQEIQAMPSGFSAFLNLGNVRERSFWLLVKKCKKSKPRVSFGTTSMFPAFNSSDSYISGLPENQTLSPALIPSFLWRGVPEYPAVFI